MKIFMLEDGASRTHLVREAIADSHIRLDHTTHVEGVGGAKDIFDPPYDLMLLDHDLGGHQFVSQADPETGTAFVKWLVASYGSPTAKKVIVHSYNLPAGQWMVDTLRDNAYDATYMPFGLKLLRHLEALAEDDND